MRLDTPYYPIPASGPEGTFGAITEILLRTRLKLRWDEELQRNDEDVNTYLAGLLTSYIDPAYLAAVREVLSKYDVDVHQAVGRAQDRVQIYWIYKVNADDLLVSLGIFQRLWERAKGEMGRLQRYYSCASEYQRRIYGKPTAVGEIQTKLSDGPERYLALLSQARSDYLHFVEQLGSDEINDLSSRVRRFERELPIREKQDEMLDAYSACLREPANLDLRRRLTEILEELKKLDPDFAPKLVSPRLKGL